MKDKKHGMLHNVRQGVMVTLVLLLLCGFLFPVVLSGLSAVLFPGQAGGNLVEVDGTVVGSKLVGQEFTEDYFLWGRPSQYHYNTYYEEDTDGDGEVEQYYNDGSAFAGLGSGSANYAPSNPALITRVESDIIAYLTKSLTVTENLPADAFAALPGAMDAVAAQTAYVAENVGVSAGDLQAQVLTSDVLLSAAGLTEADVNGDATADAIADAADMTVDALYDTAAASVTTDAIFQAAAVSEEQVAQLEAGMPTLYLLQKSYIAEAAGISLEEVEAMIEAIPTDLMTASGSGLDPHISPASAELQVPRIAVASGLSEDEVRQIIAENTDGKMLGVLGEETVNVLGVNLEIAQRMNRSSN